MIARIGMLFVVWSAFVVVPVHGFRRVNLGGSGGVARHVAVSEATTPRHDVSFRPLLMSSVAAAQPHICCSSTVNPNDSSQESLFNKMVILRGGAKLGLRGLNRVQLAMVKFVLLSMTFFAANKMIECLWFFVFRRMRATLRRQPFTPTVHKYVWTDLWWPVVNHHSNYTRYIFFALFNGFWLHVLIPYWKNEATRDLRTIWRVWQLLWHGSASCIQAVELGFIALRQICWFYLMQDAVRDCFSYSVRALVEMSHDRSGKKADIGTVLVATTFALHYFLWRWYIS